MTATLNELSGLHTAKRAIRGLASGSSAHAVLFYGAMGSGKRTLANWLTKAWLCLSPGPDGGCGECKPCLSFDRGANADVLLVEPRGPSRLIKIGQITPRKPEGDEPPPLPIQEFFRTGPLQSSHKVVLMLDADRMGQEATHSFLKTLEEPESHGRLILTTTEIRRVRDTILSRCLCLACETPPPSEIERLIGGSEPWIEALGGQSAGIAMKLRETASVFEPIHAFALALSDMPPGAALKASEDFRALCESIAEHEDLGARHGNVEGLKTLATALAHLGWPPEKVQAVVETHAKVVQNASMPIASDALFAKLLT